MPATTDKKTKVVANKEKQVKRDPVVPSSNKLVSARWEDKCREIHLQKLKNMKPAIDNVPPKEYPHLTNNKKRMQLQEGTLHETIIFIVLHGVDTVGTRGRHIHTHLSRLVTSGVSSTPMRREKRRAVQEREGRNCPCVAYSCASGCRDGSSSHHEAS